MIESLAIDEIPCFGSGALPLQPLKQITFLYGPNGSGKSSIAKRLNASQNRQFVQELFDKEFVELLLRPDSRIPGVFVIRDGDSNVQQRIDQLIGNASTSAGGQAGGEIEKARYSVTQFEKSVAKQESIISSAGEALSGSCWKKRKELPQIFQQAFQGFLGDSKKNIIEVHKVRKLTTPEGIKSEQELISSYELLGDEGTQELCEIEPLPNLDELSIQQIELLRLPIKSKDETSFGELIRLLNNSDWVRQGLQFLNDSGTKCPFCQQSINSEISNSLNVIFDDFYENQLRNVREVLDHQERQAGQISNFLTNIRDSSLEEASNIAKAAEALQQRVSERIQQVRAKLAAPSSRVELPDFEELEIDLKKLTSSANDRVREINSLLRNRKEAKDSLRADVWRYYVHSIIDNDLSTYDGAVDAPTRALESLRPKLEEARQTLREGQEELSVLQQQLTSAVPTVEAINRTLKNLGFLNFSIRHVDDDDTYQLVRADGTLASQTLSEGERTLISFLYYFHKLMRLSEDASVSEGVVAVIDDPVSSLDGETLFVINLLLRKVLESCVKGTGRLKQVILLTHNAYFFKESEFTPKGMSPGDRSYFVLAKGADGKSTYKYYEASPIRSNYTQLWEQVRAASSANGLESSAWLPNAMRRIIENYFHITGGLDTDLILSGIPESDRWACQGLLAWYNDGSHTAPWDVDYSSVSADAATHLRAFRQIFEAAGHAAHYEMMIQS